MNDLDVPIWVYLLEAFVFVALMGSLFAVVLVVSAGMA